MVASVTLCFSAAQFAPDDCAIQCGDRQQCHHGKEKIDNSKKPQEMIAEESIQGKHDNPYKRVENQLPKSPNSL